MIDVTLTFNGVDLSGVLSKYNVLHTVEEVESVKTMDGEEHVASFVRPVVEFSFIPLSEDQTQTILAALSVINAEATYTDPITGTNRTVEMRVSSDLNAAFALKSINGKRYYKGSTITLRQKAVL